MHQGRLVSSNRATRGRIVNKAKRIENNCSEASIDLAIQLIFMRRRYHKRIFRFTKKSALYTVFE